MASLLYIVKLSNIYNRGLASQSCQDGNREKRRGPTRLRIKDDDVEVISLGLAHVEILLPILLSLFAVSALVLVL